MKQAYLDTRFSTEKICKPLEVEDLVVQTCPDVSPPKWHMAHTTWFFEKFILQQYDKEYKVFESKYNYLFNSYYKTVGNHWQRVDRGKLSRPTVKRIYEYREYVDNALTNLIDRQLNEEISKLIEIGINHEQQHQELLLMDIKHILSLNIECPAYLENNMERSENTSSEGWLSIEPGTYEFGSAEENRFFYDNEGPAHKRLLSSSKVMKAFVTNGQYLDFINDGGYERPELWLSLGWDWVNQNQVSAPLYWKKTENGWKEYTLHGEVRLQKDWPVQHVSLYEADAFARWSGMRLPNEFELEFLLNLERISSQPNCLHSINKNQSYYNLWSWSSSQYQAYPGYQPYEGSLGEYNQKFMCNQFVLRGGSYATPNGHLRSTYRNFFEPWQRWMFSGLRLAMDTQ